MSYIFVDVDAARRCAAMIGEQTERFAALLDEALEGYRERLEAFCGKVNALCDDLIKETEDYAAADEKMKALHLATNEGGHAGHG